MGCGRVDCNGQGGVPGWFVVCEYWPAGNVLGEFGQEVGREVGRFEEAVGGGDAGEYFAYLANKMNGGGRVGCGRLGWWVVGLAMLLGLGVGM